MSNYQTTMFNRYTRIKGQLIDCFHTTRNFHLTCTEFCELRNKKVFTDDYKKLNQYYTGKISGIGEALFEQIQLEHVEWKHYYLNNAGKTVYVDKWQDLPEDKRYAKDGEREAPFKSGHFWKNSDHKPW